MSKYPRIVVLLDGSELGERAIAPAIDLAKAMVAEIILLTVVQPLTPKADPFQHALQKEIARTKQYLKTLRSRFLCVQMNGRVETIVGFDVAQSIIRYSKQNEVDLIIMANQGSSGISRRITGNVTEKVLRGAPCNTVFICARAEVVNGPLAFNRILVPLDGSLRAETALEQAVAIAESLLAELILLHIVARPIKPGETELSPQTYELNDLAGEAVADSYLREVWSRMSNDRVSIKFATAVARPSEAIVDYARKHDVDLIVMSNHRRSGLGRWVHGQDAEKVLHSAPCVLMVIRELESVHKEGLISLKEV
jgi:nucleotide-binding universal stress UspA family protein